jgi:hypothetical protein
MPFTGGPGTTLFWIVGASALAALTLMLLRDKRSATN